MNLLKKLALLGALLCAIPALAQTAVSGTKVQDGTGTGSLLASGQWCFSSTCLTVTNGAFSGTVTAGTQSVTVTNASSATILTIPGVVIGSTAFNWNSYVVPASSSISGTGAPLMACQIGASYTQTDTSTAWTCTNAAGQATWKVHSSPPIAPPGSYTGSGAPNFACTAPCTYTDLSRSPSWKTTSQSGSSFNSWIQYVPPGSTPGGTSGAIQYNNNGAFGGVSLTGLLYGNGPSLPSVPTITQLGASFFDSSHNALIGNSAPTIGWPLPSSISNTLLWGYQAGRELGNYTAVNTTGTASSGSTTLVVSSATGIEDFNNISGAGIASGATVTNVSGTTITLSAPTTAALSSTPVSFTPGNTEGLIAIGEFACAACQSNNGSVVIGIGALENDIGERTGGEDQNGVAIGPFAGDGETGINCTYGAFFESILIGNKVGGTGCGWGTSQAIGNHINGFYGAVNSSFIGGEIGVATPGVFIIPSRVQATGDGEFNPQRSGGPAIPPGTYHVSNTNIYGSVSAQSMYGTHDNNVFGTGSLDGGNSTNTAIQNDVFGNSIGNAITSGSYNVLIGGASTGGPSSFTGQNLSTSTGVVAIGAGAGGGFSGSASDYSVAIGYQAAANSNSNEIAIGQQSCVEATGQNICIGPYSGVNITNGSANIIIGMNNGSGSGPSGAFSYNTEVGNTVGLGDNSSANTYFGAASGNRNVASLGSNVGVGVNAFQGTGTGTEQWDTFVGEFSNCNGCTSGIGVGHNANLGAVAGAVQLGTGTNSTANTMQFQNWNFLDSSGNVNAKLLVTSHGASAIPSAATIAPSASITHISGTAAINTITPPTVSTNGGTFSGCIHLIPDGAFTTTTSGNIALASTAVVKRILTECYDGTKWYPSY